MIRSLVALVLLGYVSISTGCATWETVGGYYDSPDMGFSVELPKVWYRHVPTKGSVLITRDGLPLQQIQITRYQFDKIPLVTKRRLHTGMAPIEIAEVIVDDLRSDQHRFNFVVLSSRPMLLGNQPGFRINYSYQFKDNLRRLGVYDGALVGQSYFSLRFDAPRRHYFERDLPVFEQMRNSFKIRS